MGPVRRRPAWRQAAVLQRATCRLHRSVRGEGCGASLLTPWKVGTAAVRCRLGVDAFACSLFTVQSGEKSPVVGVVGVIGKKAQRVNTEQGCER